MSVFDAELYAASCAFRYAASLSPSPEVVSLSVDNQATTCSISRPGYPHQTHLLRDICRTTSTLLCSGSAIQTGRTPSHTGIMGNELADAAAILTAEDNPPDDLMLPWPYSHLRSQMKLAASYLLGYSNWLRLDSGLAHGVGRKLRQLSTLYSAAPPVSTPGGPFLRPWTSSPPGMTPLQLKFPPGLSTAPSQPNLRDPPPRRITSPLPHHPLPLSLFAWVRRSLYLLLLG